MLKGEMPLSDIVITAKVNGETQTLRAQGTVDIEYGPEKKDDDFQFNSWEYQYYGDKRILPPQEYRIKCKLVPNEKGHAFTVTKEAEEKRVVKVYRTARVSIEKLNEREIEFARKAVGVDKDVEFYVVEPPKNQFFGTITTSATLGVEPSKLKSPVTIEFVWEEEVSV